MSDKAKIEEAKREAARRTAITVMELLKGHTPEQRAEWSNATRTCEELAGLILELTAAASRWQSIETAEDLPKKSGEYITTYRHCGKDGLHVAEMEFYAGVGFDAAFEFDEVIAWMPLPAPFTEGETK